MGCSWSTAPEIRTNIEQAYTSVHAAVEHWSKREQQPADLVPLQFPVSSVGAVQTVQRSANEALLETLSVSSILNFYSPKIWTKALINEKQSGNEPHCKHNGNKITREQMDRL